jgi:hypothetical protein
MKHFNEAFLDKIDFHSEAVVMTHPFSKKFYHEMVKFYLYALFFTLFFTAFTIYRQLIVEEYTHTYWHLGYGVIEALVIAKLIILGEMLHLGKRYEDAPLIIPTVFKAVLFSIFVLILTVLEHFVVGYFTGKTWAAIYDHLIEKGIYEILARVYVMFFVFVLFFGFKETGRVIGDRRLYELFFKKRNPNG